MRTLTVVWTCLVLAAQGHVRLKYTGFSIRNAKAAQASGAFSTAGPCGGAQPFGNNGVNSVQAGDKVVLTIAYNGGHKSASNEFQLGWACGRPDDRVFRNRNNSLASATPPKVDASASLTSGYNFSFTIPQSAAGEFCTVSALDQRNWGGCIDFKVAKAAAVTAAPTPAGPPTAPTAPTAPVTAISALDLSGSLVVSKVSTCTQDAPNCCCLHGTASITHARGASSGKLAVTVGCHAAVLPLPKGYDGPATMTGEKMFEVNLSQPDLKIAGLAGSFTMLDQKYEVGVFSKLVTLTNIDDAPLICSLSVAYGPGSETDPNDPDNRDDAGNGVPGRFSSSVVPVFLAVFVFLVR